MIDRLIGEIRRCGVCSVVMAPAPFDTVAFRQGRVERLDAGSFYAAKNRYVPMRENLAETPSIHSAGDVEAPSFVVGPQLDLTSRQI